MSNLPEVKIGVVAVSRDCFPESLSVNRRKALMKAYTEKYGTDSLHFDDIQFLIQLLFNLL